MNYGKIATKRRLKQYDSKGIKFKKKFCLIGIRAILICVVVACVVGASSGIGVLKGIIDSAPDISEIDVTPTGYSTTVYADDGVTETAKLIGKGANRTYVTIDEIPKTLQHAFVAIEDERFYDHNGIDLQGIARALLIDLKSRSTAQGASTITQQLIKNNVLTSWTSESDSAPLEKIQRKLQEQYLAMELEEKVDNKDWILENYLNSINLGANTLGVQAASKKYFGKDVSELNLSECAVIAGITQNPTAYNPITYPENNSKRRQMVLDNMLRLNYISQEEYDKALNDDVYSRIAEYSASESTDVNSYFVDALIDDVYDDLVNELGYTDTEAYKAIYQGGLEIYSTQDLDAQKICNSEANNEANYAGISTLYSFRLSFQIKKADGSTKSYSDQTMLSYYKAKTGNSNYSINYSTKKEAKKAIKQYEKEMLEEGDTLVENSESYNFTKEPQLALTVIDQKTGEVKALVGGRGKKFGNRTWNRATDTKRQPGSTFKIIGCYAPALDSGGKTLASVQDDTPLTIGSKTFRNYNNRYQGFTNIRQAITESINIVTVKTLQDTGVDVAYDYAERFGITSLDPENDKNLSLSLGGLTNGVTNLELTGAYATIANGGKYKEPKFYTVVKDHDGNILLDKSDTQESHRVIKKSTAWLLTDAMKDVLTKGTGTLAYFGDSMPQAGKSGTTTSNRDCLFAGYTPYYTCVVWGGYDDNSIQTSTSYPKKIWHNVMQQLHTGLEYKDFTKPDDIVTCNVCKVSGLLPIDNVCCNDPEGSQIYSEYFASGTVPNKECDNHKLLTICTESNLLAGKYCPSDCVKTKVIRINGSSGTEDSQYSFSSSNLDEECNIHTEDYREEEIDEEENDENSDEDSKNSDNKNKKKKKKDNEPTQKEETDKKKEENNSSNQKEDEESNE